MGINTSKSFFNGDIKSDEIQTTNSIRIRAFNSSIKAANTAGFGQLWVNSATNSELFFTTDADNDIQITSGTGLAGAGDVSLSGNTNNTLCTVTGSNAIQGESNLTFDSTSGVLKIGDSSTDDSGKIQLLQPDGDKIFLTHNDNGSRISHTGGWSIDINAGVTNTDSGEIRFRTASSSNATDYENRMVVLQSGNVGIGTDSPTKELEVNGKIMCKELYFLHNFSTTGTSSADIDLSGQNKSITVFVNQDLDDSTIQLPEATTARVGIIITIIMITNASTTVTGTPSRPKISVPHDSGNGTKIDGAIYLQSESGIVKSSDVVDFTDKKSILLDSNSSLLGGGRKGSKYTFHYTANEKVFAICNGITSSSSDILYGSSLTPVHDTGY